MGQILDNGYELQTTFWEDFTIADAFGVDAIRDTYNRAFNDWKNDHVYITELCMVMNWKMFQWFEKDKRKFHVYYELFVKLDKWCMDNLKGEQLDYFIKTTD